MRVNGKTTVLIYPDEELIVCPLNYRVEISLESGTLTVFDGKSFFKEYKIVNINLPAGSRRDCCHCDQGKGCVGC